MVTVMIADSYRRSCIHNNYNNSNNSNDGDKKNTTATKSIFFKGKVTLPLCEIQFTHSENFFVQNTVFNQMNMLLNNFISYILIFEFWVWHDNYYDCLLTFECRIYDPYLYGAQTGELTEGELEKEQGDSDQSQRDKVRNQKGPCKKKEHGDTLMAVYFMKQYLQYFSRSESIRLTHKRLIY